MFRVACRIIASSSIDGWLCSVSCHLWLKVLACPQFALEIYSLVGTLKRTECWYKGGDLQEKKCSIRPHRVVAAQQAATCLVGTRW